MIPKTRSGKTLRRVLRELVENGAEGKFEAAVNVPPTVEDAEVVDVARRRVREYFEERARREVKAKLLKKKNVFLPTFLPVLSCSDFLRG